MVELVNGIFTDDKMLLWCLLAIPSVLVGAYYRKDAVMAFITVHLFMFVVVYAAQTFNVEPFNSSVSARLALTRPALAGLLLCLSIVAINGHLNSTILRGLEWTTSFFKP
jgi:hypothetical protein